MTTAKHLYRVPQFWVRRIPSHATWYSTPPNHPFFSCPLLGSPRQGSSDRPAAAPPEDPSTPLPPSPLWGLSPKPWLVGLIAPNLVWHVEREGVCFRAIVWPRFGCSSRPSRGWLATLRVYFRLFETSGHVVCVLVCLCLCVCVCVCVCARGCSITSAIASRARDGYMLISRDQHPTSRLSQARGYRCSLGGV